MGQYGRPNLALPGLLVYFDFKIILWLFYDFKTSKSSIKSSNLASSITGSRIAVTYLFY